MKKEKEDKASMAVDRFLSNHNEMKWRCEDAMRTISKAEELKKDKKLMTEVKKMADDNAKLMKEC